MAAMQQLTASSQIFMFETLQEFMEFVDNTIQLHKSELSKYEEELGMMLRQDGQEGAEAGLVKEIQSKLEPQKKQAQKSDGKKKMMEMKEKKKEKGKEKKKEGKAKTSSANWKNYRELQILTGNTMQGKTEVYFKAVNELKAHIDKLNSVRDTLVQLVNAGISNAFYLVYTKNGVPEKLVLLSQEKQGEGKFEFKADFVTENIEVPIESREV